MTIVYVFTFGVLISFRIILILSFHFGFFRSVNDSFVFPWFTRKAYYFSLFY
jgi:hypothetical protein